MLAPDEDIRSDAATVAAVPTLRVRFGRRHAPRASNTGSASAATSGPTAVIAVRDLTKSYGQHEALRGVSFEIAKGEVFSLLGPNGAGKTTTVEILEGYRRRDAGEVEVLGEDPAR